jgi:outer membrane protein assembly factor BamB
LLLFAGLLTCLALRVPAADTKPAADWPLFRGNARQTGVASSTLPDQLEVLWKFKAKDSIEATAAIVGGVVYVGSLDENLYAFDLATGKQRWTYKAGPIKAPVSVHDGTVYAGNLDGILHAVDAAKGEKRWTFETGAEINGGANFVGDTVVFGSGDEHLYCLTKDGKQRWKFKVPGGPVMGTPAIVDNRTFAAGCDKTLHILDTDTGKEVSGGLDLGGQVAAATALDGEKLYVGTMSGQVLGVNWKKGDILWSFDRRQQFQASVALTDKLVIAGCQDKRVYAVDRQTGEQAWSFLTRSRVESSPVVVGQRVYVGSSDGNLYVLDLAKGTEVKKYALGGQVIGSPAVAEDRLVIGTDDGTVYCFGAKK